MKLGICMVTYNRLEYSQRTYESLVDTLGEFEYDLVIVDNASTDGTKKWLKELDDAGECPHLSFNENRYPGAATNAGWRYLIAVSRPQLLMRCDNDMQFHPGWIEAAMAYFDTIPQLGQLGLDHRAIEVDTPELQVEVARSIYTAGRCKLVQWPGNVGGTNIIRTERFIDGLQYSEVPWHNRDNRPTPQEDCMLSLAMKREGYLVGHMNENLSRTFAWDGGGTPPDDPEMFEKYRAYYQETLETRGYRNVHPWLWENE